MAKFIIERGVIGFTKNRLFTCFVCPNRGECEAFNGPSDMEDYEEFMRSGIMPGCDMEGREYSIYIEDNQVVVELGDWKWFEMLKKERGGGES